MKKLIVYLCLIAFSSLVIGQNWTVQTSPTTQNLNSICFVNENVGYSAGEYSILKTTNGGVKIISINVQNVKKI